MRVVLRLSSSICAVCLYCTQVDDQAKSASKLVVHLLKQRPQPSSTPAAAATASSLDRSLSLGLGAPGSSSGVEVQGIITSPSDLQQGLAASQGSAALKGLTLQGEPKTLGGGGEGFEAAGEGVAMTAAVEASADALDALVQLLEQYCHPSNTGPWSGELAVFLRNGVHYFMKVGHRSSWKCQVEGWLGEGSGSRGGGASALPLTAGVPGQSTLALCSMSASRPVSARMPHLVCLTKGTASDKGRWKGIILWLGHCSVLIKIQHAKPVRCTICGPCRCLVVSVVRQGGLVSSWL